MEETNGKAGKWKWKKKLWKRDVFGARKHAQGTFEWQLGEERKERREFVLQWWLL